MIIIDFEKYGNAVRFYLGKDRLTDYHGDDWEDSPYDCSAGKVYDEFISSSADVHFPIGSLVLEPCDGVVNSRFCKNDMRDGVVPCIVVVPQDLAETCYQSDFNFWANHRGVLKFYFGDRMEPTTSPAFYHFNREVEQFEKKTALMSVTKVIEGITNGNSPIPQIPIWEKANLTIIEASEYFGIGQNRLSELTRQRNCDFVLFVGNRRMIKRRQFEKYLEATKYI